LQGYPKYEELRKIITEYQLIVDSAEQPTARPVDYESQKNTTLVRKDAYSENQFIVLPLGQDIVDVTVGELGKQVTLICFAHPKINLTHPKSFRR
jgi:CDP-diacylglycerol pyrophosphatase